MAHTQDATGLPLGLAQELRDQFVIDAGTVTSLVENAGYTMEYTVRLEDDGDDGRLPYVELEYPDAEYVAGVIDAALAMWRYEDVAKTEVSGTVTRTIRLYENIR